MKNWLYGASVAALVIATPVAAQPEGGGFAQDLADARGGNQGNALLTPEQIDDLGRQAERIADNYNSAVDRHNANEQRRRVDTERTMERIDAQIYNSAQYDITPAADILEAATEVTLGGSDSIRETQRRMEAVGQQMEALAQQRADMIANNPSATPAQIREARDQVARMRDIRLQVDAEVDNTARQMDRISQRQLQEHGDLIRDIEAGHLESTRRASHRIQVEMSRVTLRDPQALRDALRRAERAAQRPQPQQPRSLPNFEPPAPPAPEPAANPAQTAQQPAASPRPVRRGTIPPVDPYADFRAGGAESRNQPSQTPAPSPESDAARRRAAQAQAEANAARTETARRAAQERANRENAEADRIFGAAQRAREEQERREYAEMLRVLRNGAPRPGNAGGGGGGGSGSGSGSFADQMAYGNGLPDGSYSATEGLGYGEIEADYAGQYSPTEAFIFDDGGTFQYEPDTWQSFELGGTIIVAELEAIYAGYDWWNAPIGSSGRSLSSAGNSLSSAGNSLSSAGNSLSAAGSITPSSAPTGMHVEWGGFNLSADPFRVSNGGRPEPGSYAAMLLELNGPRASNLGTNPWTDAPWASTNRDLARLLYGPLWSDRPYQVQADPTGARGRGLGGPEVANLYDTDFDRYLRLLGSDFAWIRQLIANDRGGLDRLLAQPFNVLLTWGANAYDLDLHMTGPLAAGTDRFHIYYAARGQLTDQPFAELIRDCICNSGSEVILTSALNRGSGVYRVSVFNFGDQSATSTNLSGQSQAVLQIVRGGVAVPLGNGTTIDGGVTLLTTAVPGSGAGNTWIAAEINPNNGTITAPGVIVQSGGSGSVN